MKKIYLLLLSILFVAVQTYCQTNTAVYTACSSNNLPLCPGENRSFTFVASIIPTGPGGANGEADFKGKFGSGYNNYAVGYTWYVNGQVVSGQNSATLIYNMSVSGTVRATASFGFYNTVPPYNSTNMNVNSYNSQSINTYSASELPQIQPIIGPSSINAEATANYSAFGGTSFDWSGSIINANSGGSLSSQYGSVVELKAPKATGTVTLQVWVSNSICASYYVTSSKVITVLNTPPTTPTGLNAFRLSAGSNQLTWMASNDNEAVTAYGYKNQDANGNVISDGGALASASANPGVVFSPPGIFKIAVYSIDNRGLTSGLSNSISFTNDPNPPTTPTTLSYVYDANKLEYTFNWAASTDAISGVAGYRLYKNGVLFTDNILTTTTKVAKGNLGSNLNHSFSVTGVDFLGNESAKSTPQSFYIRCVSPRHPLWLKHIGYDYQ